MAANASASAGDLPRREAAINEALTRLGLRPVDQTRWWTEFPLGELGTRTPSQAWKDGDVAQVEKIVDDWVEAGAATLARLRANPAHLAHIREQARLLEERLARERLGHIA